MKKIETEHSQLLDSIFRCVDVVRVTLPFLWQSINSVGHLGSPEGSRQGT